MRFFYTIFLLIFLFFTYFVFPHGFASDTLICNTKNSWWTLDQVSILHAKKEMQSVLSYDCAANAWRSRGVVGVASGISNCYVRISFDDRKFNDIVSTPLQEFCLQVNKKWIFAYQLKKGDMLLAKDNQTVVVTGVKFIQKSLSVISIEVSHTHTFCVGSYGIVTHNMLVPEIAMNTVPIFSVTAIGASVGLFANPIVATITGGVIACGVIGYIVKSCLNKKIVRFELSYDADKIGIYFNESNSNSSRDNQNINTGLVIGGSCIPDPEDPKRDKKLRVQTEKQLRKGIRKLEKQIVEHRQKLEKYIQNSDQYDNKSSLRNAYSHDLRAKIIKERINCLNKEIMKFEENIAKRLYELAVRGK